MTPYVYTPLPQCSCGRRIAAHCPDKGLPSCTVKPQREDPAEALIALVKEYGRTHDLLGQSRQQSGYAMNKAALLKVCSLEDQIELRIRALAREGSE